MKGILIVIGCVLMLGCNIGLFDTAEYRESYQPPEQDIPSIDYLIPNKSWWDTYMPGPSVYVFTVMRVVQSNVEYASDSWQYGAIEYWATPEETWQSGLGDCEDYAILTLYLLERDFDIKGALVFGTNFFSGEGHAWIRVDGQDYEPQVASYAGTISYENIRVLEYNEAMYYTFEHRRYY